MHFLNCRAIPPPHTLFSSQSLLLNLELTDLARLTGQRESPQDPPVSTSRPWDYKCAPHNLLLCGCRKIQTHVFPPVWQVLYPQSHLPSSRCLFDSSGRSCGLRLGCPHTSPALSASPLSLCSSVTQALVTCCQDFRLSSAMCLVFLLLMACVFTAIS